MLAQYLVFDGGGDSLPRAGLCLTWSSVPAVAMALAGAVPSLSVRWILPTMKVLGRIEGCGVDNKLFAGGLETLVETATVSPIWASWASKWSLGFLFFNFFLIFWLHFFFFFFI
ncbi:hypothetical protein RchiOBHm_Chr5g0016061 [Rosa chinensis]|uniref:Uncharacterized protein n=1 Tax=Rosa chinensis TaxID=74649 RepID=A0A2P6Q639_ROSCH|nr:hypothetical protein RchiOBHm_Chr5g0016061 [Rosa chinensis]